MANANPPQAWSAANFDPMDSTTDQDFSNLIDFESLDIDFNIGYAAHDAPGNPHDDSPIVAMSANLNVQDNNTISSHAMSQDGGNSAQSFFDFNVPQYEHGYRPHSGVPPTPNSVEMHGDPNRYLQQMDPQQAIFDQRFQVRKDDATFTPLVSPAVTPHDNQFQVPHFMTTGAYFSPLTSPALNAQSQQQTTPQQATQYTTSGSSTGTSPVDVDMDILGEPAMAQPEQGRRLRSNKRNAPRSGNTPNRVRQSPVVRPGRRKATVQTLIPHPREVSELVEEARSNRRATAAAANGLDVPGSLDSSETDSISPEPLSEMGPPPKPLSTTQSPAMMAQIQNGVNRGPITQAPATPSSLMRIQPSPSYNVPPDVPPLLDDFALPEASLDRPSLSRGDTTIYNDEFDTPQLAARKTPKLNPLSTPSGASAMSGKPSPMLGPNSASTPTSPAFSMTNRKINTKKRNSVSSNLVSPALRPKISPSIKPLLPEGGSGVTDNTHALLLASKSNYQNILDGTTVPGVVYPTSLSTNLTSKRTSHKIAEQGRRNRINTALQEMQALLPSPQLGAKDAKSPETSALQSNNSKAAKVESAIEYIKQLKQECSEKDQLLDQKDQEVEALRKELAALRRASSGGDTPLKSEPASSPSAENGT